MGMTGTHTGEVISPQIANTPVKFSGSNIADWGVALSSKTGGWSGLYALDNPTTTGGGQDLVYASDKTLIHFNHRRNLSPPVFVRTSTDDDFFGTQISHNSSLAFNGTAAFWRSDNKLMLLGNWWNNGNTGSLRYNLYDRNLNLESTGLLGIEGYGPQGRALVLSSGTILIPVHYGGAIFDQVAVIRSTNNGMTWTAIVGTAADLSINEPTIIQATNGNVLVVSRAENLSMAKPFYFSYITNDGQNLDATATAWTEVPQPTRVGGNPNCLLRMSNGTYIHIFSPGGGENYWVISTSTDAIDWTVLANIDATEAGGTDANRYLDIIERRESGSIMIVASEEDDPANANACQQCVIFISSVNVAQFTNGSYTCPISPKSCDPLYIDIYLTATTFGNGTDPTLTLGNATNILAGWQFGGTNNNQIFINTGSGSVMYALVDWFANKEKRLRWIYHPVINLIDFYINDRAIRLGDFPISGWTGLPDRITLNIADGSIYQIRKQKVWTN